MLDKEKVINDLQDAVNDDWMWQHADFYALTMEKAISLLQEQPEIVRCKDCKYNSGNCHGLYAQFVTCYKTGSPHMENWYCADGKRR